MIIHRKIGNVSVDIHPHEANALYIDDATAELIQDPDLNSIVETIYEANSKAHMPLSMLMELTNQCNFACPFCYINEPGCQKHSVPRFHEGLKDMLDYLIEIGLLHVTLSGGEPLLHPDFIEIYRHLKENGVLVTIFSNAYLFQEKHFQLFKEYPPFKLEISLYGIDDKTYRTATETQNIYSSNIFNNILRLKNIGINVICKTPLTSLTEDSYLLIQQWCNENNILHYTGNELISSYSGVSTEAYSVTQKLRSELKLKADANFFSSIDRASMDASRKIKRKIAFDCRGGKHSIFISSEFKIMPCMQAQWAGEDWRFDIRLYGIEKAYHALTKRILEEKGKPLAGCHGCLYSNFCNQCILTKMNAPSYCKNLKIYMERGNTYVFP